MSKTWNIFRKASDPDRNPVATVHSPEYHGEWMEDEYVTVTIPSPTPIDFHFGDYLTYRGEIFTIDYNPNVIKKARKNSYGEAFVYENVKLYSLSRELNDIAFNDYVLKWYDDNANKSVYSSQGKFAFFAGSIEDLADRLQANLDREAPNKWTVLTPNYYRTKQRVDDRVSSSEWVHYYYPTKESISQLTEKEKNKIEGNRDINISVDNQTCRSILALSYKNFGLSFVVRNRTIIIGSPAIAANQIFKYGKDKGLYEIAKTCDDSQSVITKLYSYGSAQNLPLNYYANMHKYFYGVIDEVHTKDPDNYHYAEFTLDIYYMAGMFNIRNMGPNNASYQVGWVVKTKIGGVEITSKVENISRDPWPKLRIYVEQRYEDTEYPDPSDEPDLDKLIAYIRNIEVGKKVIFTAGFDKNVWPQDHIGNESEELYPALLSIGNLMLPGFPDMSVDAWVRKVANGTIHSDIISAESAAAMLESYVFSTEVMSPWVKSKHADEIGVKEGSVYFDGSSDDRPEIMPSIEGTGAGIVVVGSDIKDSGFLGEKADTSFTIKVADNDALDWAEVYETKQEDIYLEMKSGFCTGRKFKLISPPKLENGSWELKLEREQDNSIGRYFPYYENNISSYCQVLSGDTFVVTGLQMPQSYVESASARLLLATCNVIDTIDHPKVTYLPKVDEIFMARQHQEAVEENKTSLHDTLMAGMCIHVEDEDLGLDLITYIDSINIKEDGNNGIPTYDVVLRDEKDISAIQRTIDIVGGMAGLGEILSKEEITKLIKQIGNANYLSKIREDETYYLIRFFGGIIADLMVQSPEFKLGEWSTDEEGVEHNDGKGFSIWKNVVDDWNMEIDYQTVRHLLRAKEFYTQTAHIGEVTNQTIFQVGLQTLGNILIGKYAEGVEGGIITPEGHVEINTLITRGLAKLQELFVVNDSTFGGSLSSIDFISDFLGGKGWSIQKKKRINAAGVEEEYYALEIDNVTVRNTLRVYEMVVSQLRGEFDNYVFAAMMEVHHYDAATGKVWLVPQRNQRAVSFTKGDYIKVQQYIPGNDVVSGGNGYIIKTYELIITDSGTGGMNDENGDRLDWVTFKNFVTDIEDGTPATVIAAKDTFVRLDNETDPERKGLMQIITVGPNTPYQDVYYGMKTDPNNAMKLRIGNLSGVRTDLFGWLEEYGAYLPNLYAVGKMFNRQTGESFNSSLEITRERLRSVYTETTFNINDEDNFLKNGFFSEDIAHWTACAVGGGSAPSDLTQQTINSGDGTPLMVNGAVLAYQNRLTAEITEYAGMKVIHILGMGIYQNFSDIKANGTHKENISDNETNPNYTNTKDVPDALYMGIRMIPISSGDLTVTFMQSDGSVVGSWSQTLNASREWQLVQAKDSEAAPWAYTGKSGRMIVSYTGECYIRFVALMTDPIVNSRETYETMIEQTSRRITLQAKKQTADLNEAVAEINIEFNNIRTTVTDNKDAADRAFANIVSDLDAETAARQSLEDTYHATWVYQNDHLLSLMAAEFNADGTIKGYADLKVQVGNISTTVTSNKSAADAAFATLTSNLNTEIGNRQALENAYHATWVYQNDHLLSLMAAEFNADGTIKGYADLKVQVDGISSTVTNNKTAADNAISNLNNRFGNLEDEVMDIDDESSYAYTWVKQSENKWEAIAASFKDNGDIKAAGKIALYVDNELSTFYVDADRINFKTGNFRITNQNGDTTLSLDANGNLYISGTVDTQLSYNSVKLLDSSYTINLSRDHYNIYILSGGTIDNEQEITLPSASSCVGLMLTFFCEFRAHTRSWVNPVLKGDFYIPTSSSYGNTGTEVTVETFKVYRLLSVGNFWAIL